MINIKRKTLIALMAALPGLSLLGFSHSASAHNDGAYNHDYAAVAHNPTWMSRVDGSKRVSQLSLPGTHDTMSIKAGDIWQNQTMTLMQQLNSGIRVFDMRTRHINDTFRMHHGIIAQDTYFDDVLRDITHFLNANPSETVLFRLRAEHTSENNTRSYAATLDSYLAQNGSKHWVPTNSNPTLDEIRGKFVILQEFSGGNYGLSYGYIDKQDDYQMSTNWDLYDKWTRIKNHIVKAQNGNRNTIYMNYLSAAVGSMPYFVSSGHSSNGTSAPRLATGLTTPGWKNSYPDFPRVSCFIGICTIAFEGTNTLTADYIANGGFTGMVMADFPGKRLIENIIKLNDLKPLHPEQKYRELKDGRSGLCLDVSGGSSANGTNVALWTCHGGQNQKWAYDASTGFMRSALGKCLDNRGQAHNGGEIVIWDCVNSNNLKFDWVGTSLRNRHNNNIAVDAYGTGAGSQVGQWSYHGGANQQWHWGN